MSVRSGTVDPVLSKSPISDGERELKQLLARFHWHGSIWRGRIIRRPGKLIFNPAHIQSPCGTSFESGQNFTGLIELAGTNCYSFVVPGQNPRTSLRRTSDGNVAMLNAAAFAQPCEIGSPGTPTGCVNVPGINPLGGAEPSQIEGPGYHKLDLSLFKNFQLTERTRLEFRSEVLLLRDEYVEGQANAGCQSGCAPDRVSAETFDRA